MTRRRTSGLRAGLAVAGLCLLVGGDLTGQALAAPARPAKKAAAPKPAPAKPPAAPVAAKPPPASPGIVGFSGSACDKPIDVTADALEVYRDQRLTIFKGNVEAIQCDARLRTPQLNLYSAERAGSAPGAAAGPGSGFGDVERMEAAGPVYYITPTQQAKGDKAVYEKAPDTITMLGNVVVTQEKNVVVGEKLVIDQKTGHSTMYAGGAAGPGRVRGVFYPQQNPPPGQPGAPAPAPAAKPAPTPPHKGG